MPFIAENKVCPAPAASDRIFPGGRLQSPLQGLGLGIDNHHTPLRRRQPVIGSL